MATLTPAVVPARPRLVRPPWLGRTTRIVVGVGVLVAVIVRVGAGPFLHGLLSLDAQTIGAAVLLAAVATAAAAWRWRLVAGRLGVELPWRTAFGMYYRSQFFNTVLPGGVVGDIHRAVAHGRSAANIPQAARAVAIERAAGQVVQLALTSLVLVWVGTAYAGTLLVPLVIGAAAVVVVAIVAVVSQRMRAALVREARELRIGLGWSWATAKVAVASVVVVVCHVATFAVATAAVGATMPPAQLLTLSLVVLLGASIPLNVGGWGPREGVAGWAFAVGGFGAATGVAASTLFGVLAIISVAPGAVIALLAARNQEKKP
jgi:uncharacterized membrane protein YbhN (UPF0104 family)